MKILPSKIKNAGKLHWILLVLACLMTQYFVTVKLLKPPPKYWMRGEAGTEFWSNISRESEQRASRQQFFYLKRHQAKENTHLFKPKASVLYSLCVWDLPVRCDAHCHSEPLLSGANISPQAVREVSALLGSRRACRHCESTQRNANK